MRKFFVIVLALGILLGASACGSPAEVVTTQAYVGSQTTPAQPFDYAAYNEILQSCGNDTEAAIRPIKNFGVAGDNAIVQLLAYLEGVCYTLSVDEADGEYPYTVVLNHSEGGSAYFVDYASVCAALDGMLSEGAIELLALLKDETENPPFSDAALTITWEELLGRAKRWQQFEEAYPGIMQAIGSVGENPHPAIQYILGAGRAEHYMRSYVNGSPNSPAHDPAAGA